MKKCNSCYENKDLVLFAKRKDSKDGLRNICKICLNLNKKVRYQNDEIKLKESNRKKEHYLNNKEVIIEKTKVYKRKSRQNIEIRLRDNLRNRLNQAIKKGQKSGSAVNDLGCSIEEFKVYLESQFQPGMNWDNWTRDGWHIDHKNAISKFDLTKAEELKKACHYSNLQPLWAVDNFTKGCS